MSKLSPARSAALQIGAIVRLRNAYTAEVASSVLSKKPDMSAADKSFARKLALGVTSSSGTLDEVINTCLRSPDDIQADVRDALRISTYELIFLDKQNHAAVDQGVELVRSIAPKAAGLANAVLRKVANAARSFPFGNTKTNIQALARSQAFPLWLAKRLIADLDERRAREFMEASNEDAPVFIAENACKEQGELAEALTEFYRNAAAVRSCDTVEGCHQLIHASAVASGTLSKALKTGRVLVSDEAAQRIAAFALPETMPESFLEVGAGRGTKTILLQSNAMRRWGMQMPLVSIDDHQFKIDLLKQRTADFEVRLDEAFVADAKHLDKTIGARQFDAVFIDAPCSGLGTLRRHPEIRWKLTPKDIAVLSRIGYDMLENCAHHVAVGGLLTFATCTVLNEENEGVVELFLKTKFGESFELVDSIKTDLQSGGCDAHYAVKLRRRR